MEKKEEYIGLGIKQLRNLSRTEAAFHLKKMEYLKLIDKEVAKRWKNELELTLKKKSGDSLEEKPQSSESKL